MLKPSEDCSNCRSPNLKGCSEVRLADPKIYIFIFISKDRGIIQLCIAIAIFLYNKQHNSTNNYCVLVVPILFSPNVLDVALL